MKKRLVSFILAIVMPTTLLTGCGNKDMFDTVYTYDQAIVELPNGEIVEGKVDNWTDYDDGDQIQVKISGVTYLVHSSKVVLITE